MSEKEKLASLLAVTGMVSDPESVSNLLKHIETVSMEVAKENMVAYCPDMPSLMAIAEILAIQNKEISNLKRQVAELKRKEEE